MNSEEKLQSTDQNDTIGQKGELLPDQTRIGNTSMPRQVSILNWINQWQPMGIRIVLNLPFVGDDHDYLFVLRSGPFIPPYVRVSEDTFVPEYPGDERKGVTPKDVFSYWMNNMRNVYLVSQTVDDFTKDFPIHITQYDQPPIISTMAQSFRRWRGDMQYRVRTVAGFATQGYVIASTLKNKFSPIGVYDEFQHPLHFQTQDASYREPMMNAYALGDTSMFRHFEMTVPYDYPVPYYDQLQWINRRCQFSRQFEKTSDEVDPDLKNVIIRSGKDGKYFAGETMEPHGDNWIVFGIRGDLAATQEGAQISFELEYRCVEGFQFADPFLPPQTAHFTWGLPTNAVGTSKPPQIITIPDPNLKSDGISLPVKKPKALEGVSIDQNRMRRQRKTTPTPLIPTLSSLVLGKSSRNS